MPSYSGTIIKSQIIIPVTIANPKSPSDRLTINGLIDTGSTACSIRETILDKLNIERLGSISILLITGKRQVGYYKALIVFDANGSPSCHEELVSPLPLEMESSIDMIIGMSVIKSGKLVIENGAYSLII
jgi:hypothetical protein